MWGLLPQGVHTAIIFWIDILKSRAGALGLPAVCGLQLTAGMCRAQVQSVSVGSGCGNSSCLLLLLEQHLEKRIALGFRFFSSMICLGENSGSDWMDDGGLFQSPWSE